MTERKATNLTWHKAEVGAADRAQRFGHKAACVWLTGLSGSGKSKLAMRLEHRLVERGVHAYVLDGDNLRHGLNSDLGFGAEAREENIRRVGEVARLFVDAGSIVITAFISPYRADRERARSLVPEGAFVEVHVSTPLEECEARDTKGLYKRARAGDLPDFTGVTAPYEAPETPELRIDTTQGDPNESAARVIEHLTARGILPPR